MKTRSIGLLASLLLLAGALPASAETVQITYTGEITSETNPVGVFGSGNLVGDTYTATYTFNTSLGTTYSSSTDNRTYGGSYYGVASPLLSASINVEAGAYTLTDAMLGPNAAGIEASLVGTQIDRSASLQQLIPFDVSNMLASYVESTSTNLPASITTPFTYTLALGDVGETRVSFATLSSTDTCIICSSLYGDVTSVTETVPSTPLPPTWTMMLAVLAGLGFVAYRRQKQAAPLAIA